MNGLQTRHKTQCTHNTSTPPKTFTCLIDACYFHPLQLGPWASACAGHILGGGRSEYHATMSVTVAGLKEGSTTSKALLAEAVKNLLAFIDGRLQQHAQTWGINTVRCELPVTFPGISLERKKSQMIVYTSIVRSLESRGFKVALTLNEDTTIAAISWEDDITSADLAAMRGLLERVITTEGTAK
jgi:hypothetical protein